MPTRTMLDEFLAWNPGDPDVRSWQLIDAEPVRTERGTAARVRSPPVSTRPVEVEASETAPAPDRARATRRIRLGERQRDAIALSSSK